MTEEVTVNNTSPAPLNVPEPEVAARVGADINRIIREARAAGVTSSPELMAACDRLFLTKGETANDALAYAALGLVMLFRLNDQLIEAGVFPAQDGGLLQMASGLIGKSVDTLEHITGQPASMFVGEEASLN